MVKPDIKHNYYADLDLPITASVDDVRKAYRKLALQFHPDRNAGNEAECVPRFQGIQAANEILSDATTKTKYDQDRRKAGLYPTPTFKPNVPTPGNPYAATSNYPPPPRRTQAGTWQRPTPSAFGAGGTGQTPTGADRFTNFPKPANATPNKGPAADRTQQFRAWQNMNSGPAPRYPPQPPPQPPPRSPHPPTPNSNSNRTRAPRQEAKMPTEEQIRSGMRYGKSAAGAEDPAVTAERQSAWQAFQKANANKPGAARNKAERRAPNTPKRAGGFDPNAPGSDERAAPKSTGHYVHTHKSDDLGPDGYPPPPPGPPPTSAPQSPSATSSNARKPFADPLRSFRNRASNEDVPYAEGNRKSTPYSSFIGEKTKFSSEGLRRSASTRDTSRSHPEANSSSSARARSTSPVGRAKPTNKDGTDGRNGKSKLPGMYNDSDGSTASTNGSSDADVTEILDDLDSAANYARPKTAPSNTATFAPPRERPIKKPTPPSSRFNPNGTSNPKAPPPMSGSDLGTQSDTGMPSMEQRKSSTNIFSFPINDDTFKSTPGKSRSVEHINTNFSPEGGFSGTFMGAPGAPDYFAAAGRRTSPARRNGSHRGARSATTDGVSGGGPDSPMPPPPQHQGAQPDPTNSPSGATKFSKEQWQNTFKDASWSWPPPPPNPPNISKPPSRKSTRLAPKSSRTDSGSNGTQEQPFVIPEDDGTKEHPLVFDEDDTVQIDGKNGQPATVADDGDAMDIDSTPPAGVSSGTAERGTPTTKEPRLYSVPPSAWRQQQTQQNHTQGQRKSVHSRNVTEPQLKTNLDDLSHVEPIARSADGLKNLADLSSTLPFQSQPVPTLPSESLKPVKLATPPIPKVPETPIKLSKASWHEYAGQFGAYLHAHHKFNRTMLAHFEAREKQAEVRMMVGMGWLEQMGDTSGMGIATPSGFGTYAKDVREDEQVRETWNVSCEKHLEAVKEFEKMRERVRRLAGSGALIDA